MKKLHEEHIVKAVRAALPRLPADLDPLVRGRLLKVAGAIELLATVYEAGLEGSSLDSVRVRELEGAVMRLLQRQGVTESVERPTQVKSLWR